MEGYAQKLSSVLDAFFDTATPTAQKLELEGVLTREDTWRLAVYVLQRESSKPSGPSEPYLTWFAASLLEEALRRGWDNLPEEEKAGLRDVLLHFLLHFTPRLPPFVANKLATVSANVARLDWPHKQPDFLSQLEASLGAPDTRPGALLVLSTSLEQFEAVSPNHPGRDTGQVLWARAQELQVLLEPVYPGVLASLTRTLREEAASGHGGGHSMATLAALQKILGAFKGNHSLALKRAVCGPDAEALFDTLFLVAVCDPGIAEEDGGAAIAALDSLALLADVAVPAAMAEPLVQHMVRNLQVLCNAATQAAVRGTLGPQWWLASAKLISVFLKRHMGGMGSLQPLDGLLHMVAALTFAVRSPQHVLVTSEVWRTIGDVLSTEQDLFWEMADPEAAREQWCSKVAGLRSGLAGVIDILLQGAAGVQNDSSRPAPCVSELSCEEGTGAELEEALQAVSVAETPEGAEAEVDAEQDEQDTLETCSEAEVYANACEAIVGQFIGVFPENWVAHIVHLYMVQLSELELAVRAPPGSEAALQALLRKLCTTLKLFSRCSCHLPKEGGVAYQASQAILKTLQLAVAFPGLRANLAAAGSTAAVDQAGLQLFKVLAALSATWLPGQATSKATLKQVSDGFLNSALPLVNDAAAGQTGAAAGQLQPLPPAVLAAALEMLAVLASMSVHLRSLDMAPYTEEQLQPLLQAGPTILLGRTRGSVEWAGGKQSSLRAGRALYLCAKDVLFCSAVTASLPAERLQLRAQALMAPLVDLIEQAGSSSSPVEIVRPVATVLAALVASLKTSPKLVRQAMYQGCIERAARVSMAVCSSCYIGISQEADPARSSPAATVSGVLYQLLATMVDSFGQEMGLHGIESLLMTLLQTHRTEPGNGLRAWMYMGRQGHVRSLLQLIARCATARGCQSFHMAAALGSMFSLWEQITGDADGSDEGQLKAKGRGLQDLAADMGSLATQVLLSAMLIVQESFHNGIGRKPEGRSAIAATKSALVAQQAAQRSLLGDASKVKLDVASADVEQQDNSDTDAMLRVLSMVTEFLDRATGQSGIAPSFSDVQQVLSALTEMEDNITLSEEQDLGPALAALQPSLMRMLHSWRFSTIETDIVEALYVVASGNWEGFAASLPAYVSDLNEVQYGGANAQKRAENLLGSLKDAGRDQQSFARAVSRFLNDLKHYQSQKLLPLR
eukprot:CAMPEP_0117662622 /NCGR_PEP_ID=MMETSP0804-20121206/8149_1 /TAXON_ID=1074897 /ORGANISM="Tetraselmis astigmatica, Strain CCMP880" /LENGTH=1189 /DNA_ID=CAMNT_0005469529 /DNA_START=242 /DNA_END=3811 /DNA_ORIENTATION=+